MKFNSAVILCGGRGTRLGSLGKKIQKLWLKFIINQLFGILLKHLKNSINHFILPLGYKGNLIKKYINMNPEFKKLNIDLIETGLNTSISKEFFL